MKRSKHTFHPDVLQSAEQKEQVRQHFETLGQKAKKHTAAPSKTTMDSIGIPLSTVSCYGNFDAYITIQFNDSDTQVSMVVDSGNAMLIVPQWEALEGLPGYTVLGTAQEPWGCPANVVQGPILIPYGDGDYYTLDNCVFYACTGDNQYGDRTANFGAGRPTPWSANGWNLPFGPDGIVMQAPLSYNTAFPYASFVYAPAAEVFSSDGSLQVSDSSQILLTSSLPGGYTMLPTIENLEWMSVVPLSLSIGDTVTGWPGSVNSPIAMVDTGGGPVFLSDPNGYVYDKQWPDPVSCPSWASGSTNCNCISDSLTLTLGGGGSASFSYTIDTSSIPSVAGLTAVMCEINQFMMNQQGMNIGGISALFNSILVDYSSPQVGFQSV